MRAVKYILSAFLYTVKMISGMLFSGAVVGFLIAMWFIPVGLACDYENSLFLLLYIPVFIIAGIIDKNDNDYYKSL